MSDNPLDQIPEFDRISLRAVLVIGDADPTEALSAAGIVDPVTLPVVLDDGSGDTPHALTPGIRAVLEFEQPEAPAQTQQFTMPADIPEPPPPAPGTRMLPASPLGQPLAPIRPRPQAR
ncbi:MAG TPA: hypothetical protein VE690_02195 [Rhodopila sp.]|nr:hypothetical protein [Rhodopila sp.]